MAQTSPHDLPVNVATAAHEAHSHVGHVHAGHVHAAPETAAGFSLLRLSALERLGGAAVLLAGLWALVFWALN
jgi:hypothetical protein